jgi:gliding motility-associated lipoprotein GldH
MEDNTWSAKNAIPFEVDIPEPGLYALSFHIRFSDNYTWSNIWLSTDVSKADGKNLFTERFNIPLTDNDGRPLQGMTGAYADRQFPSPVLEQRPLPITFKEAGTYTINLKQEMRSENLEGIASIGLKLERLD